MRHVVQKLSPLYTLTTDCAQVQYYHGLHTSPFKIGKVLRTWINFACSDQIMHAHVQNGLRMVSMHSPESIFF